MLVFFDDNCKLHDTMDIVFFHLQTLKLINTEP